MKLRAMDRWEYMTTLIVVAWEYEIVPTIDNNFVGRWKVEGLLFTKLNEYGAQGWELVSSKENRVLNDRSIYDVIFKRKIESI